VGVRGIILDQNGGFELFIKKLIAIKLPKVLAQQLIPCTINRTAVVGFAITIILQILNFDEEIHGLPAHP
jgi:hypothetical protein